MATQNFILCEIVSFGTYFNKGHQTIYFTLNTITGKQNFGASIKVRDFPSFIGEGYIRVDQRDIYYAKREKENSNSKESIRVKLKSIANSDETKVCRSIDNSTTAFPPLIPKRPTNQTIKSQSQPEPLLVESKSAESVEPDLLNPFKPSKCGSTGLNL